MHSGDCGQRRTPRGTSNMPDYNGPAGMTLLEMVRDLIDTVEDLTKKVEVLQKSLNDEVMARTNADNKIQQDLIRDIGSLQQEIIKLQLAITKNIHAMQEQQQAQLKATDLLLREIVTKTTIYSTLITGAITTGIALAVHKIFG